MVPGFEPTTFGTWVSSHKHLTRVPAQNNIILPKSTASKMQGYGFYFWYLLEQRVLIVVLLIISIVWFQLLERLHSWHYLVPSGYWIHLKLQTLSNLITDTFLNMGQSRPLFVFISLLFTSQFNYKLKKCRCYVWDSNPGRIMVGVDWSTDLWRPSITNTFYLAMDLFSR